MGYATNRRRLSAYAERMAAHAARRVPETVPPGFVLAPGKEPLAVDIGEPAVTLEWERLSEHFALPDLAGLMVSSEVHCWADASGPECWLMSGEMNAWRPSFRMLKDGCTLRIHAYRRGVARLYPAVVDSGYVRRPPSEHELPLPGRLAEYAAPLHRFDFD